MRFFKIPNPTPLKLSTVLRKKMSFAKVCRRHDMALLFLHGSLARDRHGPLSDIDLAVYAPKLDTLHDILAVQEEFSKILGRDDVDIGLLHKPSSLLAMQVLLHGKLLYAKDQIRNQFAAYVTEAVL